MTVLVSAGESTEEGKGQYVVYFDCQQGQQVVVALGAKVNFGIREESVKQSGSIKASRVFFNGTGKLVASGVIDNGETREVDVDGDLVLWVSDGGAVLISIEGKDMGRVGPEGQATQVKIVEAGQQE